MLSKPIIKIKLFPIVSVDNSVQLKIRDIRNESGIRKWMYTDHIIKIDEHLSWIKCLESDKSQMFFVVMDDKKNTLGVIYAIKIDRLHKKTDWGYYLTQTARGGLGAALEYSFIDFMFNSQGIEKLNCEIIEGNETVIKLHKKYLFNEEGFKKSNIIRNGNRVGVYLLGLTKEEWINGKRDIHEKYKAVLNRYSISIHTDNPI
jgi:UDP-4-amino-4,6-dideoxy-N-acetyl-beta-L-altrosamine N-acetyltransferase